MKITLTDDKDGKKTISVETDNVRALYQDAQGKTLIIMSDETTVYVRESVDEVNTLMKG